MAGLNRPAIHSFQLVTKTKAGSISSGPSPLLVEIAAGRVPTSRPGLLAVVEAPAVGRRVGEHAQLALGRVLRHADGNLLGHARRLVESVLGIDLQPAPLLGAGRALEVVRLRLAEGEEAADPVVAFVDRRDPDRPFATDDRAVGEGLPQRRPAPRVTPPAHLALGVRHLEFIRTGRQRPDRARA